ncbi:lethal giant larvae like, C-terminal-domain-containing protein [Tricharina praecox]|uniref:lethal giant larvae like, C-terminal-domain-containing protein n=1 Tax=Tricharina praecox TaxID=43433 RepID=UPI00221FA86C|nr:lethal giant larvae like, C-terminal-domain-containing protein [Tricharina praecox]KAI5855448.1 lethal giant larvae like, C-terminal-domain-containing protein [Tricharina praecox]
MDFLRSKQSGIQRDFSGSLAAAPDVFTLDQVAKLGLSSTISTLAYDPVQSLLAVGTFQSSSTSGCVHIFGQKRVHVVFRLARKASVKAVQLCDSRAVVLDSSNDISIFDLASPLAAGVEYSPPGTVTTMRTEPGLDWILLGMQTGEVLAYDIDRRVVAPLRIPNLWRERAPKARLSPVVSLALHPKDVGTLLIAYSEGAVIYSFKQAAVMRFLEFVLPPGAPGADTELATIRTQRRPAVTQALWHPTGTFVCTAHEDSVMAVWNPKDGALVQSRTLEDAGVHLPGSLPGASDGSGMSVRQPIYKIAWCATSNPDDTSLLIAGGNPMTTRSKGLALMDLGPTPNMLTSSVQVLADHFAKPRRQRILPMPTEHDVVDFCVIPRTSPHYGGGYDPLAVIALLASGELVTLRFPDGQPLSPAALLHPSLILTHPFSTRVDVSAVQRQRWLGMARLPSQLSQPPPEMIVGGIEHPKPLRRYENRTVIQSSHPNGTVRIWDLGHGDEIENGDVLEIDVARVLLRAVDLNVECVSLAGISGETAVGMETGEVVVFRWAKNTAMGRHQEEKKPEGDQVITDVRMRADPDVKEGLMPACILDQKCGAVIALKMSDVGFCAVGYQTGHLCVLDMRGPAVIFHQSLGSLSKDKRTGFRRSHNPAAATEKATCLEFGVMTLEGDEFSSIALFVGTNLGRVLTFKLLPQQGGGFTCTYEGVNHLDDNAPILSITPINSDSGKRTWATPQATANLREGIKTPGVIVCASQNDARIFKPSQARGAHKTWGDEFTVHAASVCELEAYGICLTTVTSLGLIINYTVPGLKPIGAPLSVKSVLEAERLHLTTVLESGHILGWSGEHELTLLYQWGLDKTPAALPLDTLYNPATPPPSRPTISNLQWLAGTQYITTADLDLLIGGPDRPMSFAQQQQLRDSAAAEREAARRLQDPASAAQAGPAGQAGEGVFAGMARNMRERTEKLSFTTDTMDRLEESSASFAEDVSKYVSSQKKKAILGGITGKWF